MSNFFLSILVFTYNRDFWIERCINSILDQKYNNIEIIIADNCSNDNTSKIVNDYQKKDKRILYMRNETNLGLPSSMNRAIKKSKYDHIMLMADDDIMGFDSLKKIEHAFLKFPSAKILTRSYKMYKNDFSEVIRTVVPPSHFEIDQPYLIEATKGIQSEAKAVIESLGQISGLVFKKDLIPLEFHPNIWITHNFLFCKLLGHYQETIYLNSEIIKVEIGQSLSRNTTVYENYSPIKSWVDSLKDNFKSKEMIKFKKDSIVSITNCVEGIVQVRCFGGFKNFIREAYLYARFNPKLLLRAKYYFFVSICLFLPPIFIIFLTDFFKNKILKNLIKFSLVR